MKPTTSNKQRTGNFNKGNNRGVAKPKYKKPVTSGGNYYGKPTSTKSYSYDKYDNYGRAIGAGAGIEEYGKCQSIAISLMNSGNKAHIKHNPTVAYIKSVLKNNIQDPTAGFLHITERGLDGISFNSMKEEFDILHPNELKTNVQPFIDAIFNSFVSNGLFDRHNNDVSIIKLLVREKNCIEKVFGYDKMALLASKYAVEYTSETLITIDMIKARMLNSLAETVFAIEAELAKGPIDIKHDETRVNFIKVPIRSFLMEYASCCQETLNLVKPKRVR